MGEDAQNQPPREPELPTDLSGPKNMADSPSTESPDKAPTKAPTEALSEAPAKAPAEVPAKAPAETLSEAPSEVPALQESSGIDKQPQIVVASSHTKKSMRWEKVGRVLATAGLIVLLILGAWGIIIIALNAPGFFSNIGGTVSGWFGTSTPATSTSPQPQQYTTTTAQPSQNSSGAESQSSSASSAPESLSVTASPNPVSSDGALTISWTGEGATGARAYLVSYGCVSGLTMKTELPDNTYRDAPCGAGFNYTNAQSQLTLKPELSGSSAQTTITVSSISLSTGSTTASQSINVSVNPASATSSTGTGSYTRTYSTKPRARVSYNRTYRAPSHNYAYSNPNGQPDLAARILAVGYISPQGVFVPFPTLYQNSSQWPSIPLNQPLAVRFEIKNVGTKTVPPGWEFTGQLPSLPLYTYTSSPESALTPGSGIVFTLTWQNNTANTCPTYQNTYQNSYQGVPNCPPPVYPPQLTVTIIADPSGAVPDANRANNTASLTF